jgi:phospholipid/cholesterol/gamma-HCH transport system ATP-binding protein
MDPTSASPTLSPDTGAPEARGVAVTVRDLRRKLGGREVLCGLSFEVNPGEIFVVMGPSGSGKSVLLKHLIGLLQPDDGDILLNGRSLEEPDTLQHVRVAMVFQSAGLLNSLTVAENVGLYLAEHRLQPRPVIRRIVSEKLDLLGLAGEEKRYPSELSGGMKKRVAIARALVINPELILYDEPTSELDPLMAAVISEEIVRLRRRSGVTSIVVSHDRSLAFRIADRIALLDRGQFLVVGTPDEVRACPHPLAQKFLNA